MTKLHDVSMAHVPITARPPRSICEETREGAGDAALIEVTVIGPCRTPDALYIR